MCASVDDDISALLDEMEMENYVSFLQDESVFQELSRLELPEVEPLLVNTNDGDETDEIPDFHDALDYFQLQGNNAMSGSVNTVEQPSMPPLIPSALLCVESELHCSNNDTVLSNEDLLTTTQYTDSTDIVPDLVTQQNIIRHDHTYAADTPATTDSVILAPTILDSSIIETSKSSSSDTDEGNTSDTSGYDTVTVSPSSTRSSFSSSLEPSKALSPVLNPGTPPLSANFSKLITDPVKLIDERIQFFMNRQEVDLTEEEKDTLRSEGLPIPTTLPLTKTEERALKTVRRKIRNKIAAQESRKKKKQYMQCLEEKVQQCTQENRKLHKKVHSLETENKTLLQQLAQLQLLVAHANPILGRQVNIGRCLMVVVLCFGVLCGNLLPYRVSVAPTNDYSTSTVRSRSLLSLDSSTNWFKWTEYFNILSPTVHTLTNHHYNTNSVANSLWYYHDNSTLCFDLHY